MEYFLGSRRGEQVRQIIESDLSLCTPSVVLFEIKNKLVREGKEWKKLVDFITQRSVIEPLTGEMALSAVDVRRQWGLNTTDALIYATALEKKTKLLTGDLHFQNVENVEFI